MARSSTQPPELSSIAPVVMLTRALVGTRDMEAAERDAFTDPDR
jgi:hypothetical protein